MAMVSYSGSPPPSLQDVEEAVVTLLEGSAWEEAIRIVSGAR